VLWRRGHCKRKKIAIWAKYGAYEGKKGVPCYRPPKISVCDAYSQLVRVLSIFYTQVIHISGITYVNGVFTGFTGHSILHFFVEGLWKVILQDIVGMSFFLIYIVVIFFHKGQIVEM
jgi:hypothetical protein